MLLLVFLGCAFPFLMTAVGAATVFFFRKSENPLWERLFSGFAAGVMLAASVWSLLLPAIASAETLGIPGWIPTAVGVMLGVLFLLSVDLCCPAQSVSDDTSQPTCVNAKKRRRSFLLQFAMTLHNIPEGMAVGLLFALAADSGGTDLQLCGVMLSADTFYPAVALALGIGIQNLPEGAAVSLPQLQCGIPARRAFLRGCFSGIVEPIGGMLCAVLFGGIASAMPWLLSFAAGAMIYVTVEALIPASNTKSASDSVSDTVKTPPLFAVGTLSVAVGFVFMMILDIALC